MTATASDALGLGRLLPTGSALSEHLYVHRDGSPMGRLEIASNVLPLTRSETFAHRGGEPLAGWRIEVEEPGLVLTVGRAGAEHMSDDVEPGGASIGGGGFE